MLCTKLICAQKAHANQIIDLFTKTGYDLAAAKYNLLNQDPKKYLLQYKIIPSLPITSVIIGKNIHESIQGMITCGTVEQINNHKVPHYPHPRIIEIFEPLISFPIPDSFHIDRLSVKHSNNGFGSKLFNYAEQQAYLYKKNKITLFVWSCQINSIKFFLNKGMYIKQSILFSKQLPCSSLLLLEKNLLSTLPDNYFSSDEYINLNIL